MEFLIDLINKFNEGDTDFLPLINGFSAFLNVLEKKGLIDKLDFNRIYETRYENEFLLFLYEHHEDEFWNIVSKQLNDVVIEGGVPKLVIDNQGELAVLFCDNYRSDMSRDVIEELLDGEYDSFSYGWSSYDLTDNIYRDVIEELTKENLLRIKEYIIDTLKNTQVEPHTELLEEYAQKQGHPEYVIIDQSNIDQIVDDEETMIELMDNELDELKGELYNIYGSAYNYAYENTLYKGIWNKLSTYVGKSEWVNEPHPYKENTTTQKFKVNLNDIDSIILDFLNENKGYYGSRSSLEYYGSLLVLIADTSECLRYYPPDYPDNREVDKNINMYFRDYI
jgi:hypothetical protein